MKVAVYYSNTDIRIEERPVPKIAHGEMLVRMKASGICGTDVMEWYRAKKAPCVLGHEMAGEVVSIGNGVEQYRPGDRVFVSHHVPCYACAHCTRGQHTACATLHKGNYEPGGFSEYVRIPAENVKYGTLLLPHHISFEEGTMIEPLGCVLAGQRNLLLTEGSTVLVLGSGISGILHLQVARKRGARVFMTDVDEYRIGKAKEFGSDGVFDARTYTPDDLRRLNSGMLADAVIVCTASPQAAENAFSSVERGGDILFFAVPEQDMTIPSVKFWRNEFSLRFSYGASPDDLREALDMVQKGEVKVKEMITHTFPVSSIKEGFHLVSSAKNSLKVVIVPDTGEERSPR